MLKVTQLENYRAGTKTQISKSRLKSAQKSSRYPGESSSCWLALFSALAQDQSWWWPRFGRASSMLACTRFFLSPPHYLTSCAFWFIKYTVSSFSIFPLLAAPSSSLLKAFIHPCSSILNSRNVIGIKEGGGEWHSMIRKCWIKHSRFLHCRSSQRLCCVVPKRGYSIQHSWTHMTTEPFYSGKPLFPHGKQSTSPKWTGHETGRFGEGGSW